MTQESDLSLDGALQECTVESSFVQQGGEQFKPGEC